MLHFIFIQQISVLNILNMLYNLHFFSSKCRLFHNATLFGFCITHILNTGVLKLKKKIRRQKVNKAKQSKHRENSMNATDVERVIRFQNTKYISYNIVCSLLRNKAGWQITSLRHFNPQYDYFVLNVTKS